MAKTLLDSGSFYADTIGHEQISQLNSLLSEKIGNAMGDLDADDFANISASSADTAFGVLLLTDEFSIYYNGINNIANNIVNKMDNILNGGTNINHKTKGRNPKNVLNDYGFWIVNQNA